jgi:hypothetical protein
MENGRNQTEINSISESLGPKEYFEQYWRYCNAVRNRDYKGLIHGCLYCRSCGAVYDTIGSLLAPIKLLFGRMPSKIICVYEFSEFKEVTKINNPDFSGLRSINPFIIQTMIEDGRLTEEDDFEL